MPRQHRLRRPPPWRSSSFLRRRWRRPRRRASGGGRSGPYTDFGLPGSRIDSLKDGCTLQIATRHVADTVIAAPAGRIDHQSAQPFETALAPLLADAVARRSPLVLDFSGVDYISSVGLRVLMVAARQMREHETPFLVASLRGVVAEIFAISRFDRVLTVAATLDDALAQCSPAARAELRSAGPAPAS